MSESTIQLTHSDLIILAGMLANQPVKDTAKELGVTRQTVSNRRKKVRKYVCRDSEVAVYRAQLYELVPLVYRSLLHNLLKCDGPITVQVAKGLGLLPGNDEELKDMLRAALTDKQPVVITNVVGQMPELKPEEQRNQDANDAAILNRYSRGGQVSRF